VVSAGDLTVPDGARGVVVFAHGSGSGRASPRNRLVASRLLDARIGTLLIDLLGPGEEDARFDIGLLTARLLEAVDGVAARGLPVGCFGASTGAAAALGVAAARPELVRAVVSRGGRPDLTPEEELRSVRAPVLLVVGGNDTAVIGMNRAAMAVMTCETRLEIVPGASHLFEEPGTLEVVADVACDWFLGHF
jgi:pimeloyl-ACP methyl ester carboxylesterase